MWIEEAKQLGAVRYEHADVTRAFDLTRRPDGVRHSGIGINLGIRIGPDLDKTVWRELREAYRAEDLNDARSLLGKLQLSSSLHHAFWRALRLGWVELLDELQSQIDPSASDAIHLRFACLLGDAKAVWLLLRLINSNQDYAQSLVLAGRSGNVATIQMMLDRADAKDHGSQALVQACRSGSLDAVRLLLPKSSSIVAAIRALPLAAACGHLPIVELLLEADLPDKQTMAAAASHCARASGHPRVAELLARKSRSKFSLPPCCSKPQRLPLHLSSTNGARHPSGSCPAGGKSLAC